MSENSFLSRVDVVHIFEGATDALHLKRLIDMNAVK